MKLTPKNIAEVAKETLWPTRCAVCDAPGEVLCEKCRASLPYIDLCSACLRCGAADGREFCTECNDVALLKLDLETYPLDALRCALVLDDKSIKIITAFKDNFEIRLANVIANIMAEYAEPEWWEQSPSQKTLISYIPSTKEAFLRRGFSHMEMIATQIAKATDTALLNLFLPPISSDQRKLSRKERIKNMQSTIKVDNKKIELLRNKGYEPSRTNVIIVDDVCTTGSTLFAASDALRAIGFPKVYGLTFARAQN